MKYIKKITCFIFLLIPGLGYYSIDAQQYKGELAHIELRISGTSTLKNWEIICRKAHGNGGFVIENKSLKSVSDAIVSIQAEDLKSGNETMDKHTYNALKKNEYPEIKFALKETTGIVQINETTTFTAAGHLTVAGTTQLISINMTGRIKENGISFIGKFFLKMTDFNIEPPVFMGGMLKTGNEIDIHFESFFNYLTSSDL